MEIFMNVYKTDVIEELLKGNRYPGRGIVIGKSADGKSAVTAYFIMGRSENSRNRVFTEGVIYDDGYLKVTAIPTKHCPPMHSYAFLLEGEGKRVVFSGDLSQFFRGNDFPLFNSETTDLLRTLTDAVPMPINILILAGFSSLMAL